jgi:hypothetical protein
MAANRNNTPVKIEEEKTAKPSPVFGNFAIAQQPITFRAKPASLHAR